MKRKAKVLAATASVFFCAAIAGPVPALAADRFGEDHRGALRPPAKVMAFADEPAGSGVDTRGRSFTMGERHTRWPVATEVYRNRLPSRRLYDRRDQIALSLRFGDVSGLFVYESSPLWPVYAPRYRHRRLHAPRHRPAPLILNEWPHAPWFQDTPRYRHARPHLRQNPDMARDHRARPDASRVRPHQRPAPVARRAFRRWGD